MASRTAKKAEITWWIPPRKGVKRITLLGGSLGPNRCASPTDAGTNEWEYTDEHRPQ